MDQLTSGTGQTLTVQTNERSERGFAPSGAGWAPLGGPPASAQRPLRKAATGLFVAALALIPVALAARLGFYSSFVDNSMSAWSMWGTFVIHMFTRPSRNEVAITTVVGLAMRLAYDVMFGESGYSGYLLIGMGTFLGFGSLLVLAVQSIRAPIDRRTLCRKTLAAVAIFSYLGVFLAYYVSFARVAIPKKLDFYLFCFESSLGIHPGFVMARILRGFTSLSRLEALAYDSFGVWFAVLYGMHVRSRREYPVDIFKLLVVNPVIGFSLYFLFPAAGPLYAFPSFPDLPSHVQPAVAVITGIPNAMPSLHFGGALLICWMSKPWKWFYRASIVLVAATGWATLAWASIM